VTDKEPVKLGPKEAQGEKAPSTDKFATKEEAPPCNPVLLHPEEWDDPPECTVISEFHKGETQGIGAEKEDPDLGEWLDHWKSRHSQKVLSEYHQDGAPFLEELPAEPVDIVPPEDEPMEPEGTPTHPDETGPDEPIPDVGPELIPPPKPAKPKLVPSEYALPPYKPKKKPAKKPDRAETKQRIERALNVQTIEFLAYTVIRALFPRRVRYSVKREGVIDMDVVLYERDIILNTNRLVFEVPELSIWRIVYAYKGKPVVELGRGVKNNIKIYKLRLIRIFFGLWWAKRFGRAKTGAKDARREERELKEEEDTVESEAAKRHKRRHKGRGASSPVKAIKDEEE
jgi:hypothetical protein